MWPPHASPTEKATSSVTPNAASLGLPAFNTFCASSKTAPSMQPFDTEPAIFPERVTAILEPSGRGLDPHVSTTVARAISSPAALHSSSSASTSRMSVYLYARGAAAKSGEQATQVIQRLQVVGGQKVIRVGQRRGHASGERLVTLRAE